MIFNQSFFYSQVTPSENNYAVNCLNRDVQLRNMRKVKINANIAFVIWILEWIANASIYICWVFAPDVTILMAIMWYYIFLPHIFLMNTSHNKDLIVDDGLKTTILNACKLPFQFQLQDAAPVEEYHEENGMDNIKQNDSSLHSFDFHKDESVENNERHGVFTISKYHNRSTKYQTNLPNVPEPIS